MKMKKLISLCLAAVLAVACCGCSAEPETPAQVVEKMRTALLETPCGHAQIVMDMTLTLDGGEYGTIEMSSKTTNDIKISQEPVSGYTTATVDVDYGGEKSSSYTENYSVVEDGEIVSYIQANGVWMKVSTGQTPEGLARSASSVSVDDTNVAIDEAVTEYEGKEVICLVTQITGDALQGAIGGMLEAIGQEGGSLEEAAGTVGAIDYSALTCDVRIYLDKETYLPIAEEMTFSGMNNVLNPLYEQMGMSAEVTTCTASATFLSYDSQEETVLPEGAKEKAEKWMRLLSGEPDNGDGTYTIREGTAIIDIVPPEGFELTDKGYDHVYFKRDDYREVRYTVHYGTAEYFTSKMDRQLNRYGNLPKNVSREQISLAGDVLNFETDIVGVEWQSYEEGLMYAWADLGSDGNANYFIFIEVEDGYNDGTGNKKSADVTPDEFMAYLNAAMLSDLME